MIIILELLVSSIRVLLLFFGAVFTYILGENLYRNINNVLFTYAVPCMELLSLIIATIAPIAYFFGIHKQKAFLKRTRQTNYVILVLSFLFGLVMTFLPITSIYIQTPYCSEQITLLSKILQSLLTGILTSFIVFLSFDIGVFQSLYLSPVLKKQKIVTKRKQ